MTLQFSAAPPLSLYVHIPWCVRKCPYCDFNSHEVKGQIPEREYVDALLADLDQELAQVEGRCVQSIFIGGGTPSVFSPQSIRRLLTGIDDRLTLSAAAEITMEANPGTLEQGKFAEFRAAGVNRLSIGIQSFETTLLQRLGRIHGRDEALLAAGTVREAGFENFNFDLMVGLPGQNLQQALADLQLAMEFKPPHLSWYQLTIETNTRFYYRPPELPPEDVIGAMQEQGQQLLARRGYGRYEISAYAADNRHCIHNVNYWRFGDYLGIGAGAHGKLTDTASQRITRTWKRKHPRQYLTQAATPGRIAGERILDPSDAVFEFMLNALRLTGGFSRDLFEQTTGLPFAVMAEPLAAARQMAMIEPQGAGMDGLPAMVRPTELGLRFHNDLVALFLPEERTRDAGCVG